MKHSLSYLVALSLLAAPALGHADESWQDKLKQQLQNDNVSRTIGTVAGALLGSQIGDGRGQVAAIAAGAVAGYWLGGKFSAQLRQSDRAGIANATEQAIRTGETTTWRNPDTGMEARVSVRDEPAAAGNDPLRQLPPLDLVDAWYTPTVNLNVRGGPGTDYRVLYTLAEGVEVPVLGRVRDSDWLVIAEGGEASGFVYEPLTRPSANRAADGGALRQAKASEYRAARVDTDGECRQVTQQVTLGDGARDAHDFRVCRQADGQWVQA